LTIAEAKSISARIGLSPSRAKGQNFLVDQNIIDRIIKSADLGKAETVLEVGPGFGVLTRELVKEAGQVVAVELDKKLFDFLQKELGQNKNLKLLNADILKNDPGAMGLSAFGYRVVANLPYNITSFFLRRFLESPTKPREMMLMVQKEVAQRLMAKPGKNNLLSLSVQFYGESQILFEVKKESFWPEPQVDSAVIKIKLKKDLPEIDAKYFFRVLRVGFSAKRKQLQNNLAAGFCLKNSKIREILAAIGLEEKIRAQELALDKWLNLANQLKDQILLK